MQTNEEIFDNYKFALSSFGLSMKEKFDDTKGVIRSHQSKDRQHNGQKGKDKRTNNDLQNTTDRATRTPLKTG